MDSATVTAEASPGASGRAQFQGACERDIICRTSPPFGFTSTANAVARMVFTKGSSSYPCTGTLLNNTNSPKKHMFWTANHCIST